jgi:hypothetical protein
MLERKKNRAESSKKQHRDGEEGETALACWLLLWERFEMEDEKREKAMVATRLKRASFSVA